MFWFEEAMTLCIKLLCTAAVSHPGQHTNNSSPPNTCPCVCAERVHPSQECSDSSRAPSHVRTTVHSSVPPSSSHAHEASLKNGYIIPMGFLFSTETC